MRAPYELALLVVIAGCSQSLFDAHRGSSTTDASGMQDAKLDSLDSPAAPQPCAAALAITGLVAYLPLDEGSGTIAKDKARVPHDAELSGVTWVTGRIGHAITFDASTDFAVFPPGFDNLGSLTVCTWIRTETAANPYTGTLATLVDKTMMGGRGWSMYLTPNESSPPGWRIAFFTNYDDIAVGGTIPISAWVHVCAAWNGASSPTSVSFFQNGQPSASISNTAVGGATFSDVGIAVRLGATNRTVDSNAFQGSIDEVLLYDHALSAPEIASIYQCAM